MSWQQVRLRHLAEFNPAPPAELREEREAEFPLFPMEAINEFSPPEPPETRPLSSLSNGYSFLDRSDVAYAKVTPCFENGKGLIGSDLQGPSFATTEVTVLRPKLGTDQRFLSYLLRSSRFRFSAIASMTGAGGLKRVSESAMRDFRTMVPPLSEQRRIADYLDHETTQIDNFVRDLELLVETLTERQNSLSDQTFAPFVSSALRADLRGALVEVDQRAGVASPEDLLSVSIATGINRWVDQTDDLPKAETLGRYKNVRKGDIVMNRMRAFQGAFGVSNWDGVTSPDYAVLRVSESASAEFLTHLMKSERFVHQIRQKLRGIGTHDSGQVRTPRLSVFDLIRIPASLPERSEQECIAREWESSVRDVEDLKDEIYRFVELAKERRAALISAAVTGKLDVTSKEAVA